MHKTTLAMSALGRIAAVVVRSADVSNGSTPNWMHYIPIDYETIQP